MNCEISRDQLWAWVHDQAEDDSQNARLSRHVADCASCRSSVAQMRALVEDIQGLSYFVAAESDPPLPAEIGEYRIVRKLGQGGMGVVFEAEQQAPRRSVALKVVRAGQNLDEYQARLFRREMQALARLNHPSIAAIYDAGVNPGGQSYIAMELVEGQDLTQYLQRTDAPPPTVRERLRLFRRICDAVIHAHQRGVIHRDLKPSNIMLTFDGQPKVLDFGLAQATEGDANAVTMALETGRLIGTLQYMSPEQARGEVDTLDVRTDVYALGVVLFEMLTGVLPYDVSGTPLHESLRIICEKPPINPRALNQAAPRDVATIVLKALEKDPARRYPTVAEMADDVSRYLTNHPIQARPAGRAYRFAKLLQRHKLASGLLTAILLLSIGSTAVFALQADRISTERDVARREARKAGAINQFLRDMLASVDPRQAQGREVSVREMVDRTARTVGDELRDLPEVEAAVRDTIGQVYNALTEYAAAEEHLARALEVRRALHAGDHPDVADSLSHLGEVRYAAADYGSAESLIREALAMRRRLFGERHAAVATSLNDLGALAWHRAEMEEAESLLREALRLRLEILGPDHPELAQSHSALALLLRDLGRFGEAESHLRDALETYRANQGESHPNFTSALNNLALVLRDQDDFDGAEELYRQALQTNHRLYGERHAVIAANLANLGQIFAARGDFTTARDYLEQALDMDRHVFGDEHPNVAMSLNHLAAITYTAGDVDGAEQLFLEALRIKRLAFGDEHPEVAADLNNLGVLRQSVSDFDQAETYFRQALAVNRAAYGDQSPAVATNLNNLATVFTERGDYDAAEKLHREVLALRRELFGARHLEAAKSLESLADALFRSGQFAAALDVARECQDIRRAALGADNWSAAVAERIAGASLVAMGRYDDAELCLLHSLQALQEAFGSQDHRPEMVIEQLVRLYESWGKPEQAAAWRAERRPDARD